MFSRLALSFLLQTISLYKDKCIANSLDLIKFKNL